MRFSLLSSSPWRRLLFGLAVALPLFTACSSGGGNDAVDAANNQNADKISDADVTEKQEADAQFMVKATSNALLGVELGKLAQARAITPVVRTYGARLVQNRLGLLSALRSLASAKQLAVPNALGEDEQAAYHEVSTQAGAQLDKRTMDLILKIQKQDADAFDDMKDDAYDGDIRGVAAKYEPSVREELAGAEEVAEAIEDLP
jgi:putative membrane protein